jgi:hypothetical protein
VPETRNKTKTNKNKGKAKIKLTAKRASRPLLLTTPLFGLSLSLREVFFENGQILFVQQAR